MNNNTTKVIVPCRFSYLHCWEPAPEQMKMEETT